MASTPSKTNPSGAHYLLGSRLRRAFDSLCPMAERSEPRGAKGGDRSGRNPTDRFFRLASSPEQSLGAHLLQTPGPLVARLQERLPFSQILPGLDRPLHLGRLQPFETGSKSWKPRAIP